MFITGAGNGIGAASARRMAALGASLALAGIPAVGVEAVTAEIAAEGGRALAVPADVTREDEIEAAIIVSSITPLDGRTPNVSYMIAKTGLLGLNRHTAVHYAKHGIRSNAVCPGTLARTPDWDAHPDPEGRRRANEARIPLGRLGSPEDIAPWIAFLASDDADNATGACFVVDGGITVA